MSSGDAPRDVTDGSPAKKGFLIPSPVVTRRMRTISQSERAARGPTYKGRIREFCREKGHGFIDTITEDSKETYFVHISDIEGEFVPQINDEVTFNTVLIPPRNEKYQAVNVNITHLAVGALHCRWNSPASPLNSPH